MDKEQQKEFFEALNRLENKRKWREERNRVEQKDISNEIADLGDILRKEKRENEVNSQWQADQDYNKRKEN